MKPSRSHLNYTSEPYEQIRKIFLARHEIEAYVSCFAFFVLLSPISPEVCKQILVDKKTLLSFIGIHYAKLPWQLCQNWVF